MAINEWWTPDSGQKYWMEATGRNDLGEDLRAPKGGTMNQAVWSYNLVAFAQPGDVVFHWHTAMFEHPALVGWSIVLGPLKEERHAWTTKAGAGKNLPAVPRPHWVMPLGGLHLLDRPIFVGDLQPIRGEVLAARRELEASIKGASYFPFNTYKSGESLRAMQGYFTKFPSQLVAVLNDHFDLEVDDGTADAAGGERPVPPVRRGSGQGYMNDSELRMMVEKHAVERAIAMYNSLGATRILILGKPYDLNVLLDGQEVRVEVKGSTGVADTVIVTSGEVNHAHGFARTELIVVDSMEWSRDESGVLAVSGGRIRRWPEWNPSNETLIAKSFQHTVSADWVLVE